MRSGLRTAVLLPSWLWMTVFLAAPFALVVGIAFATGRTGIPPYEWRLDLSSVSSLWADRFYLTATLQSLRLAVVSAALCLLIGYPMALAIARSPAPRRPLRLLLVMLPFWTGFLLRITAWIGILRDEGFLNAALLGLGLVSEPLHILYTTAAMYVGMTYCYLPFMVLPLYARLSRQDPLLEQAAADLGATPWRAFLTVTLPLSLPGVWAGLALVAIPAMGEYVIPELLGGPSAQTIGRALWNEFFVNRDWPMASAVAVALLVILLLPISVIRARA